MAGTNRRIFGTLWTGALLLVAVTVFTYSLLKLFTPSGELPLELTISAGSESGLRHNIANTLAGLAGEQGFQLSVIPTSGSVEAMQKVNDGELDFALAQGGIANAELKNLRQAAVLHVEPLHVLVKADANGIPDHWTIENVGGRLRRGEPIKINLSKPGSGTHVIASDLLNFFGLVSEQDFLASELGYGQLLSDEISADEMPDLVFTVSSLPSPVAKHLIERHGFRPLELNIANAYRLDWTAQSHSASRGVIRRKIVPTTIPAYTYQINPPVPKVSIATIGTRLQMIASKETSQKAVEKMLALVYESSFSATADPPLSLDLLSSSAEFQMHPGAADYLERKTPVITEKLVETTEQVLAILGTLFGGFLFAWQAVSFFRRRRRDQQFLQCISRVGEIEHRAIQFETDDTMMVDDLLRMQQELSDIKADMIDRFQKGDIDGADTLSGFLMHVNDANENLTRIILHERQPKG